MCRARPACNCASMRAPTDASECPTIHSTPTGIHSCSPSPTAGQRAVGDRHGARAPTEQDGSFREAVCSGHHSNSWRGGHRGRHASIPRTRREERRKKAGGRERDGQPEDDLHQLRIRRGVAKPGQGRVAMMMITATRSRGDRPLDWIQDRTASGASHGMLEPARPRRQEAMASSSARRSSGVQSMVLRQGGNAVMDVLRMWTEGRGSMGKTKGKRPKPGVRAGALAVAADERRDLAHTARTAPDGDEER